MNRIAESAPARTDLFDPVRLGPYLLANRIVMAPLTRSRASAAGVPTPLMVEYYAQRASAGLIIAEGTNISPQARGYASTPGLYTRAQIDAWGAVVAAVHAGSALSRAAQPRMSRRALGAPQRRAGEASMSSRANTAATAAIPTDPRPSGPRRAISGSSASGS